MRVLFCTSNLPGALIIRGVTWSQWSHTAVVHGDYAIEATWPEVRVSRVSDIIAAHSKHEIVDYPCPDDAAGFEFAHQQIGKPYDVEALFGIAVHRDWQCADKWFCSELTAASMQAAGRRLFRAESMKRVTPQQIYMINP